VIKGCSELHPEARYSRSADEMETSVFTYVPIHVACCEPSTILRCQHEEVWYCSNEVHKPPQLHNTLLTDTLLTIRC